MGKGKHPMFIVKKVLTPFLLPPGSFIIAILFVSFLLFYRKQIKLGLLNCSIGILLWAFATTPVANMLMQGLENEYSFFTTAQALHEYVGWLYYRLIL